jgi:hypothetical protein
MPSAIETYTTMIRPLSISEYTETKGDHDYI